MRNNTSQFNLTLRDSMGRIQGCGGGGLQPDSPFLNSKFKKHRFSNTMVSKVLRDLPFSQNQPLKSADD
jgi:hypothetical protein